MSSVSSTQTSDSCYFSKYCSENYDQSRQAFLAAAEKNPELKLTHSIKINAKGPSGQDLFIDVAWVGSMTPKKVIIHFSGTHGVEGHAGSAIQRSLLEEPLALKADTAILFVHALNPFGMASNRRVNENNVDLNRNFTDQRITDPLYKKLYDLINPPAPHVVDFFHLKLVGNTIRYGWDHLKATLTVGQYDYPDGLFYAGSEIQEGPRLLFEWFEMQFTSLDLKDASFVVIDVHSGAGPYAYDTIVSSKPPLQSMVDVFGKRILGEESEQNIGYVPVGELTSGMNSLIRKVTRCANDRIYLILQEFGTISTYDLLIATRNEGAATNKAKREGKVLDPNSPDRLSYLACFYLKDQKWRHLVVERGRTLVNQSLELLK